MYLCVCDRACVHVCACVGNGLTQDRRIQLSSYTFLSRDHTEIYFDMYIFGCRPRRKILQDISSGI